MEKIKLLVVDDHELFLAGIRDLLRKYEEFEVHVESKVENVKLLDMTSFDMLLTDLSMPEMNGYELLKYARSKNPTIKVYILSLYDGIGHVHNAKSLKADGYILKEESEEVFLSALKSRSSEFYLSEKLKNKINSIHAPQILITPREKQILKHILLDKSNPEIASVLSISENTVKTHRKNILSKLRASHLDNLTEFAKEYLVIY